MNRVRITKKNQYVVIDEMAVSWSAQLIRRFTLGDIINPAEVDDCLRALGKRDPLQSILQEAGCGTP